MGVMPVLRSKLVVLNTVLKGWLWNVTDSWLIDLRIFVQRCYHLAQVPCLFSSAKVPHLQIVDCVKQAAGFGSVEPVAERSV